MNSPILTFQHPADGWYQVEALGDHPNHAAGVVQVIDAAAAQSIAGHFNADAAAGTLRHGGEMLIDHEHFSDQPDQETRAYGWLQELQARADGVYGRIRWTTTGRAAVDGGDYRFFSTEYAPDDLKAVNDEGRMANDERSSKSECQRVRPMRLSGLTLTNMNNNRGQKPITNRSAEHPLGQFPPQRAGQVLGAPLTLSGPRISGAEPQNPDARTQTPPHTFAGSRESAHHKTPTKGTSMKSVCTLLGLSADADEPAIQLAVSKLLNRGDITPDALAALRAEHHTLAEQNRLLLSEQSDTLLDGCGVHEERIRNRLKAGLKPLANREDRLSYLADFGYEPGRADRQAGPANPPRLLNRGTGSAREAAATGENEPATALRIQNRASELQGKGLKYDAAWNQARREVLGKN